MKEDDMHRWDFYWPGPCLQEIPVCPGSIRFWDLDSLQEITSLILWSTQEGCSDRPGTTLLSLRGLTPTVTQYLRDRRILAQIEPDERDLDGPRGRDLVGKVIDCFDTSRGDQTKIGFTDGTMLTVYSSIESEHRAQGALYTRDR